MLISFFSILINIEKIIFCFLILINRGYKMANGKIKWFNPKKGYGFIEPEDGDKDVFIHISALEKAGIKFLNENQKISYEVNQSKGKLSAGNIKLLD